MCFHLFVHTNVGSQPTFPQNCKILPAHSPANVTLSCDHTFHLPTASPLKPLLIDCRACRDSLQLSESPKYTYQVLWSGARSRKKCSSFGALAFILVACDAVGLILSNKPQPASFSGLATDTGPHQADRAATHVLSSARRLGEQ